MRTIIPATADTIVAFHIGRGGLFNNGGYLTFLGEAKIKDFTGGLFSPLTEGEGEDEDELIDDLSPDAEWTDESGNGVGLTNAMVESGIGRIEEDGIYDTTYTMRLGDVEKNSKEWESIFREPAELCFGLDAARSFLITKRN